jgi:uncharacterized protein (TIGR02588 family)
MNEPEKEDDKKQQEEREKDERAPKVTTLEWVIAIASALIFVALIALLVFEQFQEKRPFPVITVAMTSIEPQSTNFLARAEVRNEGDKTASRLECKAEILREGKVVEESIARVEFVPPHSTKKIGFVFRENPREGELRLQPGGFEER